ncbi:MAG: hypothetical protein O3A10_15760 [Chloroflexi bacterium]|nr:hypothetical protein [Chloroflexota bacterium]MDA1148046.1 hypothetical protein [Chloroflexota bacterium]
MTGISVDFDRVLDVPEDEQEAYVQASYREYLRVWTRLRRGLALARATGDIESEARCARELRTMWPRPEVIARAAGVIHLD